VEKKLTVAALAPPDGAKPVYQELLNTAMEEEYYRTLDIFDDAADTQDEISR